MLYHNQNNEEREWVNDPYVGGKGGLEFVGMGKGRG